MVGVGIIIIASLGLTGITVIRMAVEDNKRLEERDSWRKAEKWNWD